MHQLNPSHQFLMNLWNSRVITHHHNAYRRNKEEINRAKWRAMLEKWDDTLSMRPKVLKRRIRQGIPQEYRGDTWQRLSGSETLMFNQKSFYQTLLQQTSGVEKRIMHDVNRTFPKHQLFRHVQGVGQRSLFNVLRAYVLQFFNISPLNHLSHI